MVEVVQAMNAQQSSAFQPPLIQVEDLTFGYREQPCLTGVHVCVEQGEMVGLLGPNGSGKTTLLRLLSGLLRAQAGRILLDGRELAGWGRRGLAQRVAVVPQELQVPFAFSVAQMVALGRTPYIRLFRTRTSHDAEIVRQAMAAAEVVPLAERVFNELSGGERQRVIMAMALAQQPHLLLLDEPTAHLDIKYQIEVLELVQRLNHETGVTVIAALHDLNLAARYFPRLLLFQGGVVADGSPAEVLSPHLLQRVYGVNVQVGVMHGAEHLSILPPSARAGVEHSVQKRGPAQVHIMAGCGTGALAMRALADAGISFSAGVLNIGDSDHALALRLASEVITEPPYAPISAATRERLDQRLQAISWLIVCPMPIGPGNLTLLHAALEVCQRQIPVLLLLPHSLSHVLMVDEADPGMLVQRLNTPERDYAAGEGVLLLRQLVEAGASVITNVSEMVQRVRKA